MRPKKDWRGILPPAALAVCLLLFLLVGGSYFAKYLQRQIFKERTMQLNEVTSQVRINLKNALDSHWNYLTTAVNALEVQKFDTVEEAVGKIGGLDAFLEMDSYSSRLMLLDGRGTAMTRKAGMACGLTLTKYPVGRTGIRSYRTALLMKGAIGHSCKNWMFQSRWENPPSSSRMSFF